MIVFLARSQFNLIYQFCSVRVFVICFAQFAGYLLVAIAQKDWVAITGVALTSFSSGLGEVSFLAYSSKYHK